VQVADNNGDDGNLKTVCTEGGTQKHLNQDGLELLRCPELQGPAGNPQIMFEANKYTFPHTHSSIPTMQVLKLCCIIKG
jgi:hypothetical protein